MRARWILSVIGIACVLAGGSGWTQSVKNAPAFSGGVNTFDLQGCWRVDHYLYDAALHRSWAVLIDCDHPDAPSQMVLLPGSPKYPSERRVVIARRGFASQYESGAGSLRWVRPVAKAEIRSGESVDVANRPGSPAAFLLAGTAEETAFAGHVIRVRLKVNGAEVRAVVTGPHSVVLSAVSKPVWRKP